MPDIFLRPFADSQTDIILRDPTLSDAQGTLSQLLAGLGLSAIGNVDVIGILGKTLDAIVITANGTVIPLTYGVLDKTLDEIIITANGVVIPVAYGILDELLADIIFDGSAVTQPVHGDMEAVLSYLSLMGYGNWTVHIQEYRYRSGITMRSKGVWPQSIRVRVKH